MHILAHLNHFLTFIVNINFIQHYLYNTIL